MMFETKQAAPTFLRNMKYLSLFSGIGGFEVGIHHVFPQAKCMGFSEIDPSAVEIYQRHFPGHKNLGDVTRIKNLSRAFGGIDLLVGGSPCQDFSIMNCQGKGLFGDKSRLFFEFVRILKEVQPRYFILENVASMSPANQQVISQLLKVKPVLINSQLFVPQNRKRLFWTNIPLSPVPGVREGAQLSDILLPVHELSYQLNIPKSSQTLQTLLAKEQQGIHPMNPAWDYSTAKASKSILASRSHWVYDTRTQNFRKFDPVELERLQGFPDHWTDGMSLSKRYFLLGNAVTCPVAEWIISHLA